MVYRVKKTIEGSYGGQGVYHSMWELRVEKWKNKQNKL